MIIQLTAADTVVSVNPKHPNKLYFTASVAFLEIPSDAAPHGTNGKLLVLKKDAVEASLSTMDLMGINMSASSGFTQHNPREKVGLVTKAFIEDNVLKCNGFFYAMDFPDVAYVIKNAVDTMGFSVEASIKNYEEDDTSVYVTELVFTGLSAVFAESAAFKKTCIEYLAASAAVNTRNDGNTKEHDEMTPEQIAALMAGIQAMQEGIEGINTTISGMQCSINEVKGDVVALKASAAEAKPAEVAPPATEEKPPEVEAKPAEVDTAATGYVAQVQAAANPAAIPTPTAVQASAAHPAKAGAVEKEAKIAEINASGAMSMQQKIKAITALRFAQ